MKTTKVPIDKLLLDPGNPRLHPDKNVDAIKKSLQRWGQVEPLVVQRGTNIVVGGHGRIEAMKALGIETAQVVYVDVTERSGRRSTWR